MKQKKQIKYTPAATDDMHEIFSYISHDNVSAVETLLEKLNAQIERLADFPHLGTVLSEEKYTHVERGFRFIVVHPFNFLQNLGDSIIIYRILHGRKDYLRDLFDDFYNGK
ncbi:type II toxin-antitoxin system RelE/ParE family toxin [Robertmurraya sp. P23]|uniref:type II toxin-antitoxin system RelE/ParE family toxin n=1 Tax=Robertmurraya sp. P23 TaxID=3436931 RepID=UPI003D9721FB